MGLEPLLLTPANFSPSHVKYIKEERIKEE